MSKLTPQQEIAKRGLDDLFYLCKYILGYTDIEEEPHKKVFDKFVREVESQPTDQQNGLCEAPRGSFKSTVMVIGYAVQRILKNPDIRILLDGETYTKSANYVGSVRNHLEDPTLVKLYPEQLRGGFARDREGEFTMNSRVKKHLKECTMEASGVGKAKTGMHYDLILMDDLVGKSNVNTADQLLKVIEHFQLSFALLDPGGMVLIVGTRWHQDDLYNFIEENLSDEFVISINQARYEDGEGDPEWLFFPTRLTHAFLRRQKKILGGSKYSSQYLNSPLSSEEQIFKEGDIRFYGDFDTDGPGLRRPDPMYTFMCVDPSMGENVGNDSTGIVVVGIDCSGNWYLLEAVQERLDPHTMCDLVIDFVEKYQPMRLNFEKLGVGNALAVVLKDRAHERGVSLPWFESPTNSNMAKIIRIQMLEPIVSDKRIHLPGKDKDDLWGGFQHLYKLLKEFRVDRRPRKCDVLDALSMAISVVISPVGEPKEERTKKSFDKVRWKDDQEEEFSLDIEEITGVYYG